MTSRLERKWWFSFPAGVLAALATLYLLDQAKLVRPYQACQWAVYLLCFVGFQRAISSLAWLLVVCFAPADKVRVWTR